MFCWWTAWLDVPIKSFVIFLTLSHLFEKEIYTHKHTCTTLGLNKLRLGLAQNHTANSGESWDIIKNSGGVGSRWQNKRMWNLPSSTNTSKIHLSVEKFSWKTGSWQKARLTCNQVQWRKGKGSKLLLQGAIWNEESWGASRSSHKLTILVLESYMKETGPLRFWKNHWNRQKGWRGLGSIPQN